MMHSAVARARSPWFSLGFSLLFGSLLTGACYAQSAKSPLAKFKSWDTNGDGVLEKSEVPPAALGPVTLMAKRQGLSLEKGISLKQMSTLSKEAKRAAAEKKKEAGKTKPKKRKAEETDATAPKATTKSRVRGFGTPKDASASAAPTKTPKVNDEKKAEQPQDDRRRRQLETLARSLLRQHDANKNGRLEKREWSKLRGNPEQADLNRDNALSVEELAGHLGGYGKREKDPTEPRASRRRTKSSKVAQQKTYRFLTPHERLPQGLPDWFRERDANADGQLTLREFTDRFSPSKLDEFMGLDLNRDGLIVAKEYLRATQ